jgi:hypothetical protein
MSSAVSLVETRQGRLVRWPDRLINANRFCALRRSAIGWGPDASRGRGRHVELFSRCDAASRHDPLLAKRVMSSSRKAGNPPRLRQRTSASAIAEIGRRPVATALSSRQMRVLHEVAGKLDVERRQGER